MQHAEEVGLEGFLLKPVNPSTLFDTIMQAFGGAVPEISRKTQREDQEATTLELIRGAQLLLVEDNEINQQVAKEILESAGLSVTIASNGQEAVNAVKGKHYDAVLMDIQMPVMDGHEATIEIRKDDRFKELPIIAMTAHAMAGDMEKSLKAGMNDHVTKPIDPDQLFAALRKWIPSKRGLEEDRRVETKTPGVSGADASEEPPFPESLPGFDLRAGLERLRGNKSLYRKLLLSLASDYSDAVMEIREALAAKEMDRAHGLVHSLKGVAGNLGATDLHAAATDMENLVKGADKDKAPSPDVFEPTVAALEKALSEALESLQTLGPSTADQAAEPSAESMASAASALDRDVAKRLRDAAEMGDLNQLTKIADELKSQSESQVPFCDRIIQMAGDFDFDGIINIVNEIGETQG
jgi:CheY-like chemotaxis protein/HPt (histidine-containing phosphotransfer) domain-containing protein